MMTLFFKTQTPFKGVWKMQKGYEIKNKVQIFNGLKVTEVNGQVMFDA